MERDDLRVRFLARIENGKGKVSLFDHYRAVSDADLASLGYVRLDGIDAKRLRNDVEDCRRLLREQVNPELEFVVEVADQVLAAIDQEDTP